MENRPCCFAGYWILCSLALTGGNRCRSFGEGKQNMMEEFSLLRPWLQTWWAPQDSCTLALCPKALGVRDRHNKGTEILTSVWNSAFWVQNQSWFQLGWIQHDVERTEGHPAPFPQPAWENISHLTRQTQSCSYQSLSTSNKLVLENSPNTTDQSVFTTSCFLCWIQGAYKPATTFSYLTLFAPDSRNFCF